MKTKAVFLILFLVVLTIGLVSCDGTQERAMAAPEDMAVDKCPLVAATNQTIGYMLYRCVDKEAEIVCWITNGAPSMICLPLSETALEGTKE